MEVSIASPLDENKNSPKCSRHEMILSSFFTTRVGETNTNFDQTSIETTVKNKYELDLVYSIMKNGTLSKIREKIAA